MTLKTKNISHPAKYTDSLLPVFASLMVGYETVIDPFAGTGKIFKLLDYLPNLKITAVEIEPEWATLDKRMICGDALGLPFADNSFQVCCTSPSYGNRMSDKLLQDGYKRITYANALGRNLSENNSGSLRWGRDYKEFHTLAWIEVRRVLRPYGSLILNIKNHIRNKEEQLVTEWHTDALCKLGFSVVQHDLVSTPSMRFGQNGNARISHESVIKFILHK
jgi:DNA modification methylase